MIVTLDANPALRAEAEDSLGETSPARSALAQAGCSESDIRAFLDDAASQ